MRCVCIKLRKNVEKNYEKLEDKNLRNLNKIYEKFKRKQIVKKFFYIFFKLHLMDWLLLITDANYSINILVFFH